MALPFNRRVLFPNLTEHNHVVTSPETDEYNCMAWACGIDDLRVWPQQDGYWWPDEVLNEESLAAFTELFVHLGYEGCDSDALEDGFEKVVIYADGSEPTHAALQLQNGRWTSKLGDWQDIEHDDPADVEGRRYGRVAVILRRPRR